MVSEKCTRVALALIVAAGWLHPRDVLAQGPAYLVKDIRTTGPTDGAWPGPAAIAGGTVMFLANDGIHGEELWRTDGTAAGTVMVKDIAPGSTSSTPADFADINGMAFFSASDSTGQRALWKSDGTAAGTERVKGAPDFYGLAALTNVNGTLFFRAMDITGDIGLWRSDGTAAGTVLVKGGFRGLFTEPMVNVNGTLFFIAYDATFNARLWKSDGTEVGTVPLTGPLTTSSGLFNLVNCNGTLYFLTASGLWRSDGTPAGTVLVKGPREFVFAASLTDVTGTLFFTAFDSTGAGLWKSDGTPAGTVRVLGSPELQQAQLLTSVNGTLFFSGRDATGVDALWKSDGTPAGTVIVKGAPDLSSPFHLVDVNGALFFVASASQAGSPALWRSDGTPSGTIVITASPDLHNAWGLRAAPDGTLLFRGYDATAGGELWRSDGTPEGTHLIKDINVVRSSDPVELTAIGPSVFFRALGNNDTFSGSLWKSDGTEAGTHLLKGAPDLLWPMALTNVNGTLFVGANDFSGASGGLWKSDGTAAGTIHLKGAPEVAGAHEFLNVGGTLFFAGVNTNGASALWKSDGTAAGTVIVTSAEAPYLSDPGGLANVDGTLYVRARLPNSSEYGLWKSDGTPEGTVLMKPAQELTDPDSLIDVNGVLFFTGMTATAGRCLWKSDGTPVGTVPFKCYPDIFVNLGTVLTNVNGTVFFVAPNLALGTAELWKSDGTPEGTVLVKEMPQGSDPSLLRNLNGTLVFRASDVGGISDVWRSDGTAAGTYPLTTGGHVFPNDFLVVGSLLLFSANDSQRGRELWASNGTPAGTFLLQDLAPEGDGAPTSFAVASDKVFFSARADALGRELWAMNIRDLEAVYNRPPAITVANAQLLVNEGQIAANLGAFQDVDGDAVALTASAGTVTKSAGSSGTWTWSLATNDGPSQSQVVTIAANDGRGGIATTSFSVIVNNVPPSIVTVVGPSSPIALGVAATVVAQFVDAGAADTHTCTFDWDDEQPPAAGLVSESGGSGSCTGSRIFAAAGVYAVKVTVRDDDGGADLRAFEYVVVYDPAAGFVTGSGWITSPSGALVAGPSLTGQARFAFVSRYHKGTEIPSGQTEFQFRAGDFQFTSMTYDWLVVSGARAQFKGTGAVNGSGLYGFLLTATDGDISGGGQVDKFRIKIWEQATGALVYDNVLGASDRIDAANPQAIHSGSIVIHRK